MKTYRRLFENDPPPSPPAADAPPPVEPPKEGTVAEPKPEKKPRTIEEIGECLDRIEEKLDYFGELVLDTEAIVEEIAEEPPVVAVVTPPAEAPKPETAAPKPPAQEEHRQRRHVLA